MINGTSKILKASRLLIIRAIVMMGLSIGNIILKKICLSEAPITLAARIGSDGNAVMPAYISRNMNGVHCQARSEEHTSELQSRGHLVCRLLLEKKKTKPEDSDCVVLALPFQPLCT